VKLKLFGRWGEDAAEKFLKKKGYRILARNYRTKSGELDIIAMDGDTLVFVEVKSRSSDAFGGPIEAVDANKQARMTKAALAYMVKELDGQVACRFDVVGVRRPRGGKESFELVRDAFEAGGGY